MSIILPSPLHAQIPRTHAGQCCSKYMCGYAYAYVCPLPGENNKRERSENTFRVVLGSSLWAASLYYHCNQKGKSSPRLGKICRSEASPHRLSLSVCFPTKSSTDELPWCELLLCTHRYWTKSVSSSAEPQSVRSSTVQAGKTEHRHCSAPDHFLLKRRSPYKAMQGSLFGA